MPTWMSTMGFTYLTYKGHKLYAHLHETTPAKLLGQNGTDRNRFRILCPGNLCPEIRPG